MTVATDLEIQQPGTLAVDLSISRAPAIVLKEAREAAQALRDVILQKDKPVIFNGEQYLEFEDWQTLARFYGLTARVRETHFIQYGDVTGFEASADAILVSSGMAVSAAEAMCLNDEERWSSRTKYEWQTIQGKRQRVKVGEDPVPLFQLRSMAQTRACAKALRNVLAWVVVLAGYRPTPAEEMTGNEYPGDEPPPERSAAKPRPSATKMPERKSAAAPPANGKTMTDDSVISEPQRKRFYAIWKGTGIPEDIVKTKLEGYGYKHTTEISRSNYEELCDWAANFGRDETLRSDYDDAS